MSQNDVDQARRIQAIDALRQEFEATVEARADRSLRAQHHPIIAYSPFAAASSECVSLFRDAHFYGSISLCQAVGEALLRHMCTCNGWRAAKAFEQNVRTLRRRGFLDESFEKTCQTLWANRDDFHHLNPAAEKELEELEALALEKIRCLSQLEAAVFAYSINAGKLAPHHPKYWPARDAGALQVWLRLAP